MTIDQVNKITSYVNDVSFKLITDDEVRRLSVFQVTSHRSFDENQQPIENGIYDLRLGILYLKIKIKSLSILEIFYLVFKFSLQVQVSEINVVQHVIRPPMIVRDIMVILNYHCLF